MQEVIACLSAKIQYKKLTYLVIKISNKNLRQDLQFGNVGLHAVSIATRVLAVLAVESVDRPKEDVEDKIVIIWVFKTHGCNNKQFVVYHTSPFNYSLILQTLFPGLLYTSIFRIYEYCFPCVLCLGCNCAYVSQQLFR